MWDLWIEPNRIIAETLIDEGFAGRVVRSADAKARQLNTMARNVLNDRAWWRKQWRARDRATVQDARESRGEYLARLSSLQTKALEMLTDKTLKGTPRSNVIDTVSRIEQLKAKAIGVAEAAPASPEDGGGSGNAPFLGIVVGMQNLTPEVRKQIDNWKRKRDGGDDEGGK